MDSGKLIIGAAVAGVGVISLNGIINGKDFLRRDIALLAAAFILSIFDALGLGKIAGGLMVLAVTTVVADDILDLGLLFGKL